MDLGPPKARKQRALPESRARRGRNAKARSADGSEVRSARAAPARRGAPIAGTARKAARQKETALSRRVRPETPDQPLAPAIKRMGQFVARLRARRECAPTVAASHAGKHDRANVSERAVLLALHEQERAARDQAGSGDGAKTVSIIANAHSERPYLAPGAPQAQNASRQERSALGCKEPSLGCGLRRPRRERLSCKPSHSWRLVCGPSAHWRPHP